MQRSTETAAPAIRLIGLYRCRAMYRITNNHNNWRFGIAVRVWVRVQPQFAASTVVDNSYNCRLLVNVQTGAPSCVRGPFCGCDCDSQTSVRGLRFGPDLAFSKIEPIRASGRNHDAQREVSDKLCASQLRLALFPRPCSYRPEHSPCSRRMAKIHDTFLLRHCPCCLDFNNFLKGLFGAAVKERPYGPRDIR